jgi:hypothetical protein
MLSHTSLQRHIKLALAAVLLLSSALFAFLPAGVSAQDQTQVQPQTQPQGNIKGLEVSPFLIELDVAKGASIESEINLTNRSSSELNISISPKDFLPGIEGQPQFIPDPDINDTTFSLSSWVNLKTPSQIKIAANETVVVKFSVNPPTNAEQGTHYGAMLFSYSGTDSGGSSTEVQQSVGTILLVYYGVGRENGEVKLHSDKNIYWDNTKVDFKNTFFNTGNVHVKPKGEVYIKNIFGQIVATTFVNKDGANVLPKTDRSFVSTWIPSNFSYGRYTAESKLTYGRSRLEAKNKIVIWILPKYFVLVTALGIIFVLWVLLHGRHIHKRRVIRKHLENASK